MAEEIPNCKNAIEVQEYMCKALYYSITDRIFYRTGHEFIFSGDNFFGSSFNGDRFIIWPIIKYKEHAYTVSKWLYESQPDKPNTSIFTFYWLDGNTDESQIVSRLPSVLCLGFWTTMLIKYVIDDQKLLSDAVKLILSLNKAETKRIHILAVSINTKSWDSHYEVVDRHTNYLRSKIFSENYHYFLLDNNVELKNIFSFLLDKRFRDSKPTQDMWQLTSSIRNDLLNMSRKLING